MEMNTSDEHNQAFPNKKENYELSAAQSKEGDFDPRFGDYDTGVGPIEDLDEVPLN